MDFLEGFDNSVFFLVRSCVLLDLLVFLIERYFIGLFVLELIKIWLIENVEDESLESDFEDEEIEIVNDSDSEFEVDCEIKRIGYYYGSSDGRNFCFVVCCEFWKKLEI